MKSLFSWQFIRYCCVGIVNTLVCVSVMVILARLGLHYAVYTFFGYVVGIIVSFSLNFKITFASQGYVKKRFIRFIIVNITNLGCTEIIQITLIELLRCPELYAVITGMVSYVLLGYFANQHLVFKNRSFAL